jgi:hypothetical protein
MNIFKSFDVNSTTFKGTKKVLNVKIFAYSCLFVFVEFHDKNFIKTIFFNPFATVTMMLQGHTNQNNILLNN